MRWWRQENTVTTLNKMMPVHFAALELRARRVIVVDTLPSRRRTPQSPARASDNHATGVSLRKMLS